MNTVFLKMRYGVYKVSGTRGVTCKWTSYISAVIAIVTATGIILPPPEHRSVKLKLRAGKQKTSKEGQWNAAIFSPEGALKLLFFSLLN